MRYIAILVNVVLLCAVSYLLFENDFPTRTKDVLALLLIVAASVTALAALFMGSGESLLALYLERKALEERKRIEELRAKK